jgi:hypothetical protein
LAGWPRGRASAPASPGASHTAAKIEWDTPRLKSGRGVARQPWHAVEIGVGAGKIRQAVGRNEPTKLLKLDLLQQARAGRSPLRVSGKMVDERVGIDKLLKGEPANQDARGQGGGEVGALDERRLVCPHLVHWA